MLYLVSSNSFIYCPISYIYISQARCDGQSIQWYIAFMSWVLKFDFHWEWMEHLILGVSSHLCFWIYNNTNFVSINTYLKKKMVYNLCCVFSFNLSLLNSSQFSKGHIQMLFFERYTKDWELSNSVLNFCIISLTKFKFFIFPLSFACNNFFSFSFFLN